MSSGEAPSRPADASPEVDVEPVRLFLNRADTLHHDRSALQRLQEVTGHAVTFTDMRALRLLAIGPTTVTGVSARLQVDLSRASRHLGHLDELGLLRRTADPSDGRFSQVCLSESGTRALDRWQAAWEADYAAAVADWDPPQLARFGELLERFAAELIEHQRGRAAKEAGTDPFAGWVPRRPATADPGDPRLAPLFALVDWTLTVARSPSGTSGLVSRSRSPVGPALIRVLGLVARHGPLGVGELADRSGVVSSRASRHVQQLEAAGLVARAVDPQDRRSSRIKATPKGTALLRRVAGASASGLRAVLADWPEADAAELMEGFSRVRSGLRRLAN
jgi:DNA-binding MarR family transcriptional regulator